MPSPHIERASTRHACAVCVLCSSCPQTDTRTRLIHTYTHKHTDTIHTHTQHTHTRARARVRRHTWSLAGQVTNINGTDVGMSGLTRARSRPRPPRPPPFCGSSTHTHGSFATHARGRVHARTAAAAAPHTRCVPVQFSPTDAPANYDDANPCSTVYMHTV